MCPVATDEPTNQSAPPGSLLKNSDDAADYVGVVRKMWMNWHARPSAHDLPVPPPRGVAIGRRWYWRTADLDAWVAAMFDADQA